MVEGDKKKPLAAEPTVGKEKDKNEEKETKLGGHALRR